MDHSRHQEDAELEARRERVARRRDRLRRAVRELSPGGASGVGAAFASAPPNEAPNVHHLHLASGADDVTDMSVEPTAAERRHEGILFRAALALKSALRSLRRRGA